MAQDARTELMDKIIQRAWEDEAFKKELLANPAAAFEKATGVKIPSDIEVVAVEDNPRKLHVVIPMKTLAQGDSHDLTDSQLEAVAGGGLSWGCF